MKKPKLAEPDPYEKYTSAYDDLLARLLRGPLPELIFRDGPIEISVNDAAMVKGKR